MNIAEALSTNYLFKGLSDAQQASVVNLARERTFEGGDVMVRQFDRDSDLLVILLGSALIKSFKGETIAELQAGSVVGEISLLDDNPRSATVTAAGKTATAVLPGKELRNLMSRDPAIKAQLLENLGKLLCQRLRTANITLDSKTSPEKVKA